MIQVKAVEDKKQLASFIDFPHELFAGDPNYVPELFIAQRDLLTPGKHPFHEHSQLQAFLAYKDGKLVGRIAAILNNNYNSFNKVNDGFFGFFDCINDSEVSEQLFDTAAAWLRAKGVQNIIGPVNPSTNEPCGLLIKGFDTPPMAMMTYNKPYYAQLAANYGFGKYVDILAYHLDPLQMDQRSVRLREALEKRLQHNGITIRPINIKDFKNEVVKVREVYNAAWDKNLGFVPMTENEFNYLAKDLKMVLDTDYCLVAEKDGKFIGFALGLPDINQLLIKIKKGRLLPTGIFKLLFGKKKVNGVRVLALGVTEPYRKMGIEACFYAGMMASAARKNLKTAEASWILEHNTMMRKGIENMSGKVYKEYRIYTKAL